MHKLRSCWFLLLLMVCIQTPSHAKPKTTEIVILCTNDIHGRVDNFPKLAAYVQQVRKENANVLLINSGDMFSGNPLVDQYVFTTPQLDPSIPSWGFPMIDIMNNVGYQLTNVGNHEFDYGQLALNARRQQAQFPFICANIITEKGAVSKRFEPLKEFKFGKTKVLFLGLLQVSNGGTPDTHPDRLKQLSFPEPIGVAGKFKRKKGKNTIFIALSHLGIETDLELAKAMPEFDLILGGHSHTRIDTGRYVNNVLITQAASYLRYVSETRLKVNKGVVVGRTTKLIDLDKLTAEDASLKAKITAYKQSDPGLKVIATTKRDIKGKYRLGALMTDAITKQLGLDIAIQNGGGIRISEIKAGDIQVNTIYSLDPFRNEVIKVQMTCDELLSLFQFSTTKHGTPDLYVSGMRYMIHMKGKEFDRIELFDTDGNPLDRNKTYSVGMNSYIFSKYEFKHKDPGQSLYTTSADVLIDYVKELKEVDYSNITHRIEIVQ